MKSSSNVCTIVLFPSIKAIKAIGTETLTLFQVPFLASQPRAGGAEGIGAGAAGAGAAGAGADLTITNCALV